MKDSKQQAETPVSVPKLEGRRAEILKIAETAVQHSGGHLRLAFNEEDGSKKFVNDAAHFLKLDQTRLGRDIESYGFMGDSHLGWEPTLVMFLEEVIIPLKNKLPESYAKASEELRKLGETVYTGQMLEMWHDLF